MRCYIIAGGWNSALPAEHTFFVIFVYYRPIFMVLEYVSLQECYAVHPITSPAPLTNFIQSTFAQLPVSIHTHIFMLRSSNWRLRRHIIHTYPPNAM